MNSDVTYALAVERVIGHNECETKNKDVMTDENYCKNFFKKKSRVRANVTTTVKKCEFTENVKCTQYVWTMNNKNHPVASSFFLCAFVFVIA